jgi:hypothetical protein
LVAQVATTHPGAGTFQINWNGRNSANAVVAGSTYRYRFLSQDVAGNRSATVLGTVYVSHRHLVTKAVTLTLAGNAGQLTTSDTSCTGYSYSLSVFAHGVWLDNFCDPNLDGFQAILAAYSFAVPAAVRYNTIRVQSFGNTISAPEVMVGLVYNVSKAEWVVVGSAPLGRDDANLTRGLRHRVRRGNREREPACPHRPRPR